MIAFANRREPGYDQAINYWGFEKTLQKKINKKKIEETLHIEADCDKPQEIC